MALDLAQTSVNIYKFQSVELANLYKFDQLFIFFLKVYSMVGCGIFLMYISIQGKYGHPSLPCTCKFFCHIPIVQSAGVSQDLGRIANIKFTLS